MHSISYLIDKYHDLPRYIIHVNRKHISQNAKDGGNRPVYTIKMRGIGLKSYDRIRYAREVEIKGSCKMVYDGTQLKCGARAWIETDGPVILVDEMDYSEVKETV
jgi:hypothetical protein